MNEVILILVMFIPVSQLCDASAVGLITSFTVIAVLFPLNL